MTSSDYSSEQPLDVIVFGAAAMDMAAWVEELPRKDSIVLAERVDLQPGGAGANVAVAIVRWGFRVGFMANISTDENGRRLLDEFSKEGVDTQACRLDSDLPTAICFITIDRQGERSMVALGGAGPVRSRNEIDFEYLAKANLVYVTDVQPHILQIISENINQKGGQVVFSPGGIASSSGLISIADLLPMVDLLLLSQTELETLLPEVPLHMAIKKLCDLGVRTLVITQGSRGVTFRESDKSTHFPAFPVKNVVDTTGAGDAFAGGLLAGMLLKKTIKDAIQYGNAAAALKVGYAGARPGLPTRKEVEQFLLDHSITL